MSAVIHCHLVPCSKLLVLSRLLAVTLDRVKQVTDMILKTPQCVWLSANCQQESEMNQINQSKRYFGSHKINPRYRKNWQAR